MYNWYLKFFKKEGFLSNVSIHLNPISNIIINPTPWKPAWIFSLVVLDWEDSISFGGSTKTLLSSYKQNEWKIYHIQPLISMMSDKILELGRRHSLSLWRLNVMFGKALPNYDALYYVCVCIDRALFVFQWIK